MLLAACGSDTPPPTELLGNWRGAAWMVEGTLTDRDAGAVLFRFDDQYNYEASYGDQEEAGTYSVEGDKLYTNAAGQMKKMVKIVKLTADTLEMEMNRAGTKENLVLVRE